MSDEMSPDAYARAERLLGHHRSKLALRVDVTPRWIGTGDRFWYRVDTEAGVRFVTADPAAASRVDAFDPAALAAALGRESGATVDAADLPFREIEVTDDGSIRFIAFDARWTFRPEQGTCEREDAGPASPFERESPDGRWLALRRGDDLWLRSTETGQEFAVTDDGTPDRGYAQHPDHAVTWTFLDRVWEGRRPPVVRWSPDSRYLLFHRTDQRDVRPMFIVESSPTDGSRPRGRTYHYPMPGDERLTHAEWIIYDVEARRLAEAHTEPFILAYVSFLTLNRAWWSADSRVVYALRPHRDQHTLELVAIDPRSGDARTVISEKGETRVESHQRAGRLPLVHVFADGAQALWFSQRDGWGHLHLYDLATGAAIRQVTRGDFVVEQIAHVDEDARIAYLVVAGLDDDPYLRSLVAVGIDGGEPRRLTEPGLDHVVAIPSHGRWFVDSASTVSIPPVATVRDLEGDVVLELERADVSRLLEAGWTPPERFRTIADDGVTPIYGVLHKPYGFDASQSYPVVDHTYPGPQVTRVAASFVDPAGYTPTAEAVAALGFVVVALDGRGTPGRSKAFHDHSYRNLGGCGGQEDHVAALHQLAASRPWLDLDRVGIIGHSGGGFAAVRAMLRFPDVFHVGVAESGNHDNRIYTSHWAETYEGPYEPAGDVSLSNTLLAGNLAGKLLLMHGEADENVTPHQTMRLVDRLIAANKDFDLVIVPGADHGLTGYEHYVVRKRWDFLVRHLLGVEPPRYRLAEVPRTHLEDVERLNATH